MSQINRVIEDIGSTNLICQNKTGSSIYTDSNPIISEPISAGLLVPYNGQLYVSHNVGGGVLQWFKLGNSTGDSGGSDPSITYNRICYYADGSKFNGTLTSSHGYFSPIYIANGNLSLTLNNDDSYLYENDDWLFRDDSRISNDNNNGVTLLAGYRLNPFYEPEEPDPELLPYISGNSILVNPPVHISIDFDINVVDNRGGYVDGIVNVYECTWSWNESNIPHIYRGELIISEPSYQGVRGRLLASTIRYLCIDYISSSEYVEDADGHRFYYHYVSIVQLPSNVEQLNDFVITLNVKDGADWYIYQRVNQDLSETDECPWTDSEYPNNPWENSQIV